MGILALTADERVTDVKFTKDTLSVGLGTGGPLRSRLPGILACSMPPRPSGRTGGSGAAAMASIGQTLMRT